MGTVAKQVEDAIVTLLTSVFEGYGVSVALRPFVAETEESNKPVTYPQVEFGAMPFVPDSPGAPFGYCSLTFNCLTFQPDDRFGTMLDDMYDKASAALTADNIGPLICEPWVLLGMNDTGDSSIGEDEQSQSQAKGRTFTLPLTNTGE